jgi:hypothetical protein
MGESMNEAEPQSMYSSLVIACSGLLLPLVLFGLRFLDDNKLTSWQWTFGPHNIVHFYMFLGLGICGAAIFSRIEIARRGPLLLFVASFLAAALFWGEPEVLVDVSRYFTQAKLLRVHGVGYFFSEWGKEVFTWTDLPLVPFLYGLVFKFFGEARLGIQICTTLMFSATVVLVYYIGKLLWDPEVGLNGALLLLAIPYLYTQVPLMLVDVPTMFFFLLAIYLFTRALIRGGTGAVFLAGLALFCVFYVKYSTWVFLSGFAVIAITRAVSAPGRTLKRTGGVVLVAGVLIGGAFFLKHDVFLEQIRFLFAYQKPGLGRWGEGYVSTFFFQIHPFVTAGLLCSIWRAVKNKDYHYVNIACFVLIIFVLGLRRIRYTIPLFPFIGLLASYGIREFWTRRVRRFFVLSAVSSALIIGLFAYLPFLKHMSCDNIKKAGAFLNRLPVEEVEVIALSAKDDIVNPEVAIPLLDYYTNRRISYAADRPRPVLEQYRKSSLRFTWEYQPSTLYRPETKSLAAQKALVIIASQPNQSLPSSVAKRISGFAKKRIFDRTTGVFQYQTLLTVYFN